MNTELEALVLAYDAVRQARDGDDWEQVEELYGSRIEETLAKYPQLSRDQLLHLVDFKHRRWVQAQKRFPTIPPKA